jgi:hypothetical protein
LSEQPERWVAILPDRQSKSYQRLEATGAQRVLLRSYDLKFGGARSAALHNCVLFFYGFESSDVDKVLVELTQNGVKVDRLSSP